MTKKFSFLLLVVFIFQSFLLLFCFVTPSHSQVASQLDALGMQCQRLEFDLANVRFRSFSLVSVLLLVHAGLAYFAIFRPSSLVSLKGKWHFFRV
jgi:hypothetical protein